MKKTNWAKMDVKEIAGAICEHLHKKDFKCVLSGGTCVTIYSNNEYESKDIDFVMADYNKNEIDSALNEIGFTRTKSWRHYEHPNCPYWVEFPPAPLAVGDEYVKKTHSIETKHGKLVLLRPVDCVKDRLAAFYHWGDRQSLDQAVMVALNKKISLKEVKRWSEAEGSLDKFETFEKILKEKK
jgi:hypothetical protein